MRNYIIIGGSSGIGKELVNLLEIEGVKVFSTYNNMLIRLFTGMDLQRL